MNRRAFLKLAAGLSGALGLGLLPKHQDDSEFYVVSISGPESKQSPLGHGYNPANYKGDWAWLSLPVRYEFRDGAYHRVNPALGSPPNPAYFTPPK